jgi:TATA-box binding protein (TBP) (component of TFIID and TFIIIB)
MPKLSANNKMCDNNVQHKFEGKATQYRISTITATGSVGTELNLDLLFDELCIAIDTSGVGKNETNCYGYVYTEYGRKKSNTFYRGIAKKYATHNVKPSGFKRFDNQLTVVYKFNDESLINIKIFKNGNIQMTGIKQTNDGKTMIDILLADIKQLSMVPCDNIAKDIDSLQNINYKIALINSDFKVDFEVKRDKLHSVLKNKYNIRCSFEPCIYPGVKIQYFWNELNRKKDGICKCSKTCIHGKGSGSGDRECKKITIAVFQSGCVIITGAQTTFQIDDTYTFICYILFEHKSSIEKPPLPIIMQNKVDNIISDVKSAKKVLLKKHLIVYPE